jgi:hypothetical protein
MIYNLSQNRLFLEEDFTGPNSDTPENITFSAKYSNLHKTVTNVAVIVIEAEEPYVVVFFWRKKVRNANDEGSSWKSTANKTHM